MRLAFAIVTLIGLGCAMAAAPDVPLPRPRPLAPAWVEPRSFDEAAGPGFDSTAVTAEPTGCDRRLETIAVVSPMPRLIGPGQCGGPDMVQLEAVWLMDKSRVEIRPAAVLRCAMAEAVAAWVREEAAPRLAGLGSPLRRVENYDAFECRGRNRVVGAKLSEHGKGDAIDVRAFTLADGRLIGPTDTAVAKDLREGLRDGVCRRFTTVLGPGSDGYHEAHIHLDLAARRQGYRICQWDVREPPPAIAAIPLPLPRPAELAAIPAQKP